MTSTIEIPARFNGPPSSGNGGYSAGLLAACAGSPAVEVTLRAPPPLDVAMAVEDRDGGLVALAGDTVVMEARATDLELETPAPVTVGEAQDADARSVFRDPDVHPFPSCVVCGPHRDPGDGMRMFPGPLPGGERFSTVFRPDASLADDDGVVPLPVVWAALDCPSSGPVIAGPTPPSGPVVLARMTARQDAPLHAGEEYVSVSWQVGADGRKHTTGTALFTPGGEPVAMAQALWIELRG